MRKMVDSKCPCDAMIFHSTEGMFFCTLSSKKAIAISSLYDYEQSSSSDFVNFTFTGKERDEETGYGYFGARYMDHELMTSFISVDRYASKYPFISPYAYCAWNPVKLTDPTGDSVTITGDAASKTEALRQIQQKSKNMIFSIDENNRLTYTGSARTEMEKYMAGIIDNKEVYVDLCLLNNSYYNGIPLEAAGGFDGNTRSEDGKIAYASQVINIKGSDRWDKICKNLGNAIWHEISEAFEGGLISLELQQDASPALQGTQNPIFDQAHYKAGNFFPGTITENDITVPPKVLAILKTLGKILGEEVSSSYKKYKYER